MVIQTCAVCGQKFEARRAALVVLCSTECRLKRRRERTRAWANSVDQKQRHEAGRKLRKKWRNP